MEILFLLISFVASVAGAICGIGGGVIIKPVLDVAGLASVAAVNFLSGCTVLAMSLYSVGRSMAARESNINLPIGTPLAIGSAVGGVLGKQLFLFVSALVKHQSTVTKVQALSLLVITLTSLAYVVFKKKIKTHQLSGWGMCLLIGLSLGFVSSFLSIGGGPVNLVVLFYFFSMDTKTAAGNSLYIILFSQAASLVTTVVTNNIPD